VTEQRYAFLDAERIALSISNRTIVGTDVRGESKKAL